MHQNLRQVSPRFVYAFWFVWCDFVLQNLNFHFFHFFNLIVLRYKIIVFLKLLFEYFLSISDRSIAFNGFSKTVRNTRFSPLFYIIVHKLRARIWSRKKRQQNRKHCEENHTTTKNTREISGFCFFYQRVIFRWFFFVDRLKRVFVRMFFLGDRSKKKRLKCKNILLKTNCCYRTIWNRNLTNEKTSLSSEE